MKYGKTISAVLAVLATLATTYGVQITWPNACPEPVTVEGAVE